MSFILAWICPEMNSRWFHSGRFGPFFQPPQLPLPW